MRLVFRNDPMDQGALNIRRNRLPLKAVEDKYLGAVLVRETSLVASSKLTLTLVTQPHLISVSRREYCLSVVHTEQKAQPTLIFSVDYEGLSKLANYIGPSDVAYTCLPAPANVLSKIFLAADIFALVFEVSAGVLVSKAGSHAEKYRIAHRVSRASDFQSYC